MKVIIENIQTKHIAGIRFDATQVLFMVNL